MPNPIVGISCDRSNHPKTKRPLATCALAYAECVAKVGGIPLLLPPIPAAIPDHARACHAFIFTGGDDPRMEQWGGTTHPKASPMDEVRQAYETGLLQRLAANHPNKPVLAICLGMQLLALESGGTMDQHLPDNLSTATEHWDNDHLITPTTHTPVVGSWTPVAAHVHSKHRQAVVNAGRLQVWAKSHDGVIEGVVDPARPFCLGVQWHPERTADERLGLDLFRMLVRAAS